MGEAGQRGTHSIMQVAAQAAAFLLLCGDELLARFLQVIVSGGGYAGNACLRAMMLMQFHIRCGEGFARRARGEDQLSDAFGLIGQREMN